MDNTIKSWIAQARASGMSDADIRIQLKASGWQDIQINAYLGTSMPNAAPMNPSGLAEGAVTYAIGSNLFARAWEAARQALWQYLGLGVLSVLIASVLGYLLLRLAASSNSPVMYIVSFLLLTFVFVFFFALAQYSAVVIIAYKTTNIFEAFKITLKRIIPFFLATLLSVLVIYGGAFLLFIPGVLMALAFTLLPFVVAHENLSGFTALQRCYALAKGHRGSILVALIILSLAYAGVYFGIFIVGGVFSVGSSFSDSAALDIAAIIMYVIGFAVFYLFWPLFQTAYTYALYNDIVATQTFQDPRTDSRGKKLMIAYIIVFFLVVLGLFASVNSFKNNLTSSVNDASSMATVSSTYYDLMFYADAHDGAYPASLTEMQASDEFSLTAEELDYLTYSRSSDGSDFLLCAPLNTPQTVTEITNSYTSYYGLNKEIEDYCFTSYGQVDANGNRVTPVFD